jgi:FkbM family methyltransferase
MTGKARIRVLEMVRHILECRGMLGATYLITECAVRRYTDRQPIGHLGNIGLRVLGNISLMLWYSLRQLSRSGCAWMQWRALQIAARIPLISKRVPLFYPPAVLHYLDTPPSWVYKEIFLSNCYAPWHDEDMRTIVDLGANVGLASLYFASRFPSARIISVEANPAAVACLRKTLAGFSNIEVLPVAVSAEAGYVKLWIDACSSSRLNSSITGRDMGGREDKFRSVLVESRTLDSIIPARVDLLKVDIEGAEYEVLASPCVCPEHIRAIVVEVHDLPSKSEAFHLLWHGLISRGYRCVDAFPLDPLPVCAIMRFEAV